MKTNPTNLPSSPTMLLAFFLLASITIPFTAAAATFTDGGFVVLRCREAASTDPNFTYEFCLQCFAPYIHNVTTMEDLVGVSMKLTARNATRIVKRISRMLITRGAAMDPYCRHALGDCLELYADAKGELNDAAKDVFEYRDCFKANVEVSAAMDSASTCEDGFRERRYKAHPLAVENEVFFRLTAVLLAFINMLHYN